MLSSVEVALLVKLLVLMSVCRDDLLAEDDGASPDDLTPIAGAPTTQHLVHAAWRAVGGLLAVF